MTNINNITDLNNITYINDLEDLVNIIDTIVYSEESIIFTENNAIDLLETALQLMEEYMNNNPTVISEPDFKEILLDEIKDIMYLQFEDHILLDEEIEYDIDDILEEAYDIYIISCYTERSTDNNTYNLNNDTLTNSIININNSTLNINIYDENISIIQSKIDKLRNIPQPTQRTTEWYNFRHNLITASNAYKAFESQSTINQLIYEKCKPLEICIEENNTQKMVNVNTTFHWGQKYEPLSVLIYEDMYNTKIEDFGCIQHSQYKFIGASPDGINVDLSSNRYGRMLEIKNIVNREINGIPKKEYWIQTQLQMEVCDLDECDFFETKFTEYDDSSAFFEENNKNENKDMYKGLILYFNTSDSKPFYLYKPLHITDNTLINEWEEEMIDLYQSKNMMWIKTIYWKLEKYSCVLILRNREWFKNNIQQLSNVWNIIEQERITGYAHRAPNKKVKKEIDSVSTEEQIPVCLLQSIKHLP